MFHLSIGLQFLSRFANSRGTRSFDRSPQQEHHHSFPAIGRYFGNRIKITAPRFAEGFIAVWRSRSQG
jgi:hypothetical protein